MTIAERTEQLSRYRAQPQQLRDAVSGVSNAQLDGAPPEPGWTAREIVHHVSDIAIMGALRLRMMLLDIEVELWPIDQDIMQKRLRNAERSIDAALNTVQALVESACSILDSLRDDEWTQPRPVPVASTRSVEDWLVANVHHIDKHLDQIRYALTGTC